ncbi:hypothetical protein HO133_008935 [Letharia lupina]|uniref:Uncharacterized protein n=1 Tax=Letharia lupina TaxID=560253 RepID=A0A8H6FFC8_9LECA|nr:uncharacterized protein HO133_008935 [Letharia lupina]KAF6226071.1 hypothetical protein HO133_008935 [Letharia lupina]
MTADSEWLYGGPIENKPALEISPPIKKHLQTTFHEINFKFTEVKNIVDEMATSGVVFKIPTVFKMQLDKVKEAVDELHKVFAMDVYEDSTSTAHKSNLVHVTTIPFRCIRKLFLAPTPEKEYTYITSLFAFRTSFRTFFTDSCKFSPKPKLQNTMSRSDNPSLGDTDPEGIRSAEQDEVQRGREICGALSKADFELRKAEDLYYAYKDLGLSYSTMHASDVKKEFEFAKDYMYLLIQKLFGNSERG